jgi:TRL-like protein family
MNRSMLLIAVLLPALAGCQSYTWVLYANPPVGGAKQAQQCAPVVFGLGPNVDLSGNEAMRIGGIKIVRTVEYRTTSFHGVGKECVTAQGE